jgi:TPR repeat protein
MKKRMGENISREWDEDVRAGEVWDALRILDVDSAKGVALLAQIAEEESSLAMLFLGCAYLSGRNGLEIDELEGERWLLRSSINGSIEGSYRLAYRYFETGRIELCLQLHQNLSKLEYAPSQFNIAHMYITGKVVHSDIALAKHFFRLASRNGHIPSKKWLVRIWINERLRFFSQISELFLKLMFFVPYFFMYVLNPNSDRLRL